MVKSRTFWLPTSLVYDSRSRCSQMHQPSKTCGILASDRLDCGFGDMSEDDCITLAAAAGNRVMVATPRSPGVI